MLLTCMKKFLIIGGFVMFATSVIAFILACLLPISPRAIRLQAYAESGEKSEDYDDGVTYADIMGSSLTWTYICSNTFFASLYFLGFGFAFDTIVDGIRKRWENKHHQQ